MKAEEFGKELKSLRKNKGLTIRQLALYSKVSNAYISQIERGIRDIPSPDILQKLSKPLGVEYEELMKLAGYLNEGKKEEDLAAYIAMKGLIDDYKSLINLSNDPEEIEKLKNEMQEWSNIIGFDDFMKNIDLSDDLLLQKYHFTRDGKHLSENKIKKVLSYIRFVSNEEE